MCKPHISANIPTLRITLSFKSVLIGQKHQFMITKHMYDLTRSKAKLRAWVDYTLTLNYTAGLNLSLKTNFVSLYVSVYRLS